MASFRAFVLVIVSVAANVGLALGQSPAVAERPFEKPTGRFAVGTIDTLWVDWARDEILSKDPSDKRRVMVRIWYPAEPTVGPPAPYIRGRDEFGGFAGYDSLVHVRTNSFEGAPLAKTKGRFPVLLYSPGGSWSRFTGTFVGEWLASHGYVVVGIDHNGFNKSVLFPDGYRFVHDTVTFAAPGQQRTDGLAPNEFLDRHMFPLWVADAMFVLDQVEKLHVMPAGRFRGRFDLARIGMLGFSFGGATAIEMAVRDPRIKAAVDQDGTLFGQARSTGTSRPVMLMHHAEPMADTAESNRASSRETGTTARDGTGQFTAQSTGPVYDVTIARTHHGHFSDLSLLMYQDVFRDTRWIDPHRAHRIINAYVLAFFDHHLEGRPSDLLTRSVSPFAEVTFKQKEPPGQ